MDIRDRHVILDVDGVFCDFVGGCCRLYGWTAEEFRAAHPSGEFGIEKTFGVSTNQFWKDVSKRGSDFWYHLDPTPWADELLDWVRDRWGENFFFVTATSREADCYKGKVQWIQNFLGSWKFNRFTMTRHKHLFARPNATIIDDREDNVSNFVLHGGEAILFPGIGNNLHQHIEDPMSYLNSLEI